MSKHIAFISTKGGVGKSTTCHYFSKVLSHEKISHSVINIDDQDHVEIREDKKSKYFLYDTKGAFTEEMLQLIDALRDVDHTILIPIGIGKPDLKEVRFIVETLNKHGVLDNAYFVFTKVRSQSSKLLKERQNALDTLDLKFTKTAVRLLDDVADFKVTTKAINEFSKLVHEVFKL